MAKPQGVERLNLAVRKVFRCLKPPEDFSVSQWADRKRRLSPESSAEVGLFRTARTPYLKEPMDAFTDPAVRRVVLVAASQVGKSEFINNCIGYIMDEDPGSILFVQPTTIDAKEYSKLRIAPMIRDCPSLRRKVVAPKSRDSGNTVLQKTYPGGILTLCGSTEAHALASKPIRYVFGDERDRWARSAGTEGDPWELAMARQTTFYNAKAVEVSTPTIRGASAIEDSYLQGTQEQWCVECPHCGGYFEIQLEDLRYEKQKQTSGRRSVFTVTDVFHVCRGCGAVSSEGDMKRQPAKWVPQNETAYAQGVRSFWLNAFVSPWASWTDILTKYVNAIGNPRKLQVVYNTALGKLWEDRGDLEDEGSLLARREDYGVCENGKPVDLPEGVLVLTAGVDTQDDRLEYEIVGHGHFGETWGIRKGLILGAPDDPETWEKLDAEVLDRSFAYHDGETLQVLATFVDEGGHYTQYVRQFCHAREGRRVFAIKGRGGEGVPYTAPPTKQRIVLNQRTVGKSWVYLLGVNAGKRMIMDCLRVQTPGSRYCHFPRRDDYGEAYFSGLLSERLVYKEGLKSPWVWEVIPGHTRNEALDCRNYALAAFVAFRPDLDALHRKLVSLREGTPPKRTPLRDKKIRRPAAPQAPTAPEW